MSVTECQCRRLQSFFQLLVSSIDGAAVIVINPCIIAYLYTLVSHCCSEFTEKELEDLLDSEEDGDAWVSLEVPADFCLNPDFDRGDAWALLRNAVQQMEEM